MPWVESENGTKKITLDEVCHKETCFLNGCGDIFSAYFRKTLLPLFTALAVASGVFFVVGMIISIRLTYKIWSTDKNVLYAKEKIKSRLKSFRATIKGTNGEETIGEVIPLNANK